MALLMMFVLLRQDLTSWLETPDSFTSALCVEIKTHATMPSLVHVCKMSVMLIPDIAMFPKSP